jgi:hypothetical protein
LYCKWCGMESDDEKHCTWCGKPLETSTTKKQSETVESPATCSNDLTETLDDVLLIDKPLTDGSDTHGFLEAENKKMKKIALVSGLPEDSRLVGYLGIMLILTALSMLIVHYHKDAWLTLLVLLLPISGLLLGVFSVVPDYDDKQRKNAFVLAAITFAAGPLYGTIGCWIYSLLKQQVSTSLLALMASYLAIRFELGLAAHGFGDTIRCFVLPNLSPHPMFHIAELIPLIIISGGWGASRFIREFINELLKE